MVGQNGGVYAGDLEEVRMTSARGQGMEVVARIPALYAKA